MIFDIVRFNLFALDLLREPLKNGREISIGEYLDREGYGDGFKEDYLLVRSSPSHANPAHDGSYLVDSCRPSSTRLSSIHACPLFPQSSPVAAHWQAKLVDCQGRSVSVSFTPA